MNKASIGARIRAARNLLKLTQVEFAQHLNCSPQVLSSYERGIYVFLDYELKEALYEAEAANTTLTFRGQFGPYYVYTSSFQLLYPISDNVDYNPRWRDEYQS